MLETVTLVVMAVVSVIFFSYYNWTSTILDNSKKQYK